MGSLRQFIITRPRLSIAVVSGVVMGLTLPAHLNAITRLLIGWNVTVWLYVCLMGWLMVRANHDKVRRIAAQEDKGALVILIIMSLTAVASLAAIIFELSTVKDLSLSQHLIHYGFTGATVLGSWLLVGILFTFHYALMFYRSPVTQRALLFPDNETNPDYWDFLYFSFTIAVAAQTSDVAVMSRSMRKTVLAQSILCFLFNVAIIGLSINIAAGLLGA